MPLLQSSRANSNRGVMPDLPRLSTPNTTVDSQPSMQIKLSIAHLALVPLLAAASPTPASPIAKVPVARKRSFLKENGVADIEALKAHVVEVQT